MYFKVAFRNAKNSITDYLLYIFTLTLLLSMIFIGIYVSLIGKIEAGLQTASLPLLITFISVILVLYVNEFMVKQRAKEFANYILLGMEKPYIIRMFLIEFAIICFFCFALSATIDFGISYLFSAFTGKHSDSIIWYVKSIVHTFFYFCIIEAFSAYFIIMRIKKLEICQLMIEKRVNQTINKKRNHRFWAITWMFNFILLIFMILGITFLPEDYLVVLVPIIIFPMLFTVFSFYNWLFLYLDNIRKKQDSNLYQKEKLYLSAHLMSAHKTDSLLNGLFCICLLFSIMSFVFGIVMLESELLLEDKEIQNWMGFLQISICIIFIILYFFILSLKEIINGRKLKKDMELFHYLGKTKSQLKLLLKKQVLIDLFLPVAFSFILFIISLPLLNYKLNVSLPKELNNICVYSAGIFSLSFLILYSSYFLIVYKILKKHTLTDN